MSPSRCETRRQPRSQLPTLSQVQPHRAQKSPKAPTTAMHGSEMRTVLASSTKRPPQFTPAIAALLSNKCSYRDNWEVRCQRTPSQPNSPHKRPHRRPWTLDLTPLQLNNHLNRRENAEIFFIFIFYIPRRSRQRDQRVDEGPKDTTDDGQRLFFYWCTMQYREMPELGLCTSAFKHSRL